MIHNYLPPTLSPDQVKVCLGLISDTHMPARWPQLHATLPQIFEPVDLILHAGDVGDLWVLDELSRVAPVVAVHGNDESPDTPQLLPEKALVTVAEQRVLLWHGHYADRVDEMESRRAQVMRPKLERIARHGKRVGAKVVVFGHWHIPLVCEVEGVTLVNAGAFAAGNLITRQLIQTVAILFVLENGRFDRLKTSRFDRLKTSRFDRLKTSRFHITHIDVNTQEPYQPQDVIDLDFLTAVKPYSGSILSPELQALASQVQPKPELVELLWQLAPACWWGGKEMITREDVEKAAGGTLDSFLTHREFDL